ncbi:phage tail protein [Nautilia sp. PV-1]|nr:phage tail protein [Nautilia sp. PV-1]
MVNKFTPDFKIEVNGKDVTKTVKQHLVNLSLKDEAGDATDDLTLNFDNLFVRPNYEDKIKVWLGYKETGLYYCGAFLVQTTEKNQNSLRVSATSTNFTTEIKKKRNRSYENISLCDLVKKIADSNSLKYKCDFKDVFFKHLSQTDESDLNLLNRIAKMYNATFNIKNDTLIFIKKQGDNDLPVFEINRKNVSSWTIKYANKTLYKSVKATWHDTKENKQKEVIFGNGEPQYVLQDTFKDKSEALKRAEGIMDLLNSGIKSGNLTIDGMNIIAGAKLKLNGFGEDDGEYSIKRVTHNLSGSGYTVRVEFES